MNYQSLLSEKNNKNIYLLSAESAYRVVKVNIHKLKLYNLYHSLSRFSRQQTNGIFSYFTLKMGFELSCKL